MPIKEVRKLVAPGTFDTYIEVHNVLITHKTGRLTLTMGQWKKLVYHRHWMLYIYTNQGGAFFMKKHIEKYAHVHTHHINKKHKTVYIRVGMQGKDLRLIEPAKCRNCEGSISQWKRKS